MAEERKNKKGAIAATTAGAFAGRFAERRTPFGRKVRREAAKSLDPFLPGYKGPTSRGQGKTAAKNLAKVAALGAGAAVVGGAAGYGAYKGAGKLYNKSPKAQAFVANRKKKSAARKEKRRVKRVIRQTDKPGVEWNNLRGRQNAIKAQQKASFAAERQISRARQLQKPYEDYKFDKMMDDVGNGSRPRRAEPLRGIHGAFVVGSATVGREMEKAARTGIDAEFIRAQRRNSRYVDTPAGWRTKAKDEAVLAQDISYKAQRAQNQQDIQNFKRGAKRKAKAARKKISSPYYYRTVKGRRQRVRKGKRKR